MCWSTPRIHSVEQSLWLQVGLAGALLKFLFSTLQFSYSEVFFQQTPGLRFVMIFTSQTIEEQNKNIRPSKHRRCIRTKAKTYGSVWDMFAKFCSLVTIMNYSISALSTSKLAFVSLTSTGVERYKPTDSQLLFYFLSSKWVWLFFFFPAVITFVKG